MYSCIGKFSLSVLESIIKEKREVRLRWISFHVTGLFQCYKCCMAAFKETFTFCSIRLYRVRYPAQVLIKRLAGTQRTLDVQLNRSSILNSVLNQRKGKILFVWLWLSIMEPHILYSMWVAEAILLSLESRRRAHLCLDKPLQESYLQLMPYKTVFILFQICFTFSHYKKTNS